MNTNRITINELKNVGNWFQNHFNSLIIDKIYCHIDFELGFWQIKSATGDKILRLKIDRDLYKCKSPFYKNVMPKTLNINANIDKFGYLHLISSNERTLDQISTISDIDFIGITFWFLSKLEEIDFKSTTDRYKRFSYQDSHSFKSGTIQKPVVDEWLFILANELFGGVNYKSNYKINITHDIDSLYRYKNKPKHRKLLSKLRDSLRSKNNFKKNFFYSDNIDDPYNTFEYLMNISEKNNIKSYFFFIPSNLSSIRDGDYRIDCSDIKKILLNINKRNHKIGVHPGYEAINNHKNCINNLNYFNRILEEIGINKVSDCRMHLLRWEHPRTIYLLKSLNIKRDWTIGYPQTIGFRSGTCNRYSIIDPKTFEDSNILEYPLNIMDFTLSFAEYMGSEEEDLLFYKIKELKERTAYFNGMINILWHNNNVAWQNEKLFYENLLCCLT